MIQDMYAAGIDLKYPDTPPILFEYVNRHRGYNDAQIMVRNLPLEDLDMDEVNVIIPEVYNMTGTKVSI